MYAARNLDDAIVSFNVAQRTKLLVGPSGYTLAENPHYGDAFSTQHWNPARRRRIPPGAARSGSAARAGSNATSVAAGGLEQDEDAAIQVPHVSHVTTLRSSRGLLNMQRHAYRTCIC